MTHLNPADLSNKSLIQLAFETLIDGQLENADRVINGDHKKYHVLLIS
jgi:hypothetical protein